LVNHRPCDDALSIIITYDQVLKRKIGGLVENLRVPRKKFPFHYRHHGTVVLYLRVPAQYVTFFVDFVFFFSRSDDVISKLHIQSGLQCKTCGKRVLSSKMSAHLDWHFSVNSLKRDNQVLIFVVTSVVCVCVCVCVLCVCAVCAVCVCVLCVCYVCCVCVCVV